MAQVVAAFGSSHSTMLVSSVEHWQEMFDRVDRRAPINDFDGVPRTFDELLKTLPADAAAKVTAGAQAERHRATMDAMDRLERDIAASGIDVLVIIGDDQRELFKDAFRPAIAIYYGDTIRNAAAPAEPAADWYLQDQRKRMEEGKDRHYPCHPALATHLIEGLVTRDFDITAMQALSATSSKATPIRSSTGASCRKGPIPIVPVILNTYYPPNQPSPRRCFDLGAAIRELIEAYPQNIRVGILASGGLSHFLVNEALDHAVVKALQQKDYAALKALPLNKLVSGSSEIRNWIATAGAVQHLNLDWIAYVPGYRSQALTGVGLCFAYWH